MSEEFYDDVYVQLNIKEFEELKKTSKEEANKDFSSEEPNQYYLFKNLNFDVTNEEYIKGKIAIGGTLYDSKTKKNLGYISFDVDMNLERVSGLLNAYLKKLGKLKTVLEATK